MGEIGPKLGMNSNDNGFLGFNQHRIPLENMLMKNAKVALVSIFEIPYRHEFLNSFYSCFSVSPFLILETIFF